MKKVIALLITFSFLSLPTKAQIVTEKSVQKEDILISPYFGFPNFLTTSLLSTYDLTHPKTEQLSRSGFGTIGLTISYLLSDNLAIGGEVSYAFTQIQWKEREMPGDSISIAHTYNFSLHAQRIRILAKLNYYVVNKERSNWYLGFGLGYNHTYVKLDTDAPYRKEYDTNSLCFFPVGARGNVGYNYFFTKNIGVNAELGLGGHLLSAGITAKF